MFSTVSWLTTFIRGFFSISIKTKIKPYGLCQTYLPMLSVFKQQTLIKHLMHVISWKENKNSILLLKKKQNGYFCTLACDWERWLNNHWCSRLNICSHTSSGPTLWPDNKTRLPEVFQHMPLLCKHLHKQHHIGFTLNWSSNAASHY